MALIEFTALFLKINDSPDGKKERERKREMGKDGERKESRKCTLSREKDI